MIIPEQIRLPENIIQQIIFWAEHNNLGISQIGTDELCLLIVGKKEIGVNTVSLLASHLLIGGVLGGQWDRANDACPESALPEKEM